MIRRLVAVGAPPFVLVLGTILMVHYQTLLFDAVWGGDLPPAWRKAVYYLPLMLAAFGTVVGLRMRSCGILIAVMTAGTVAVVLNPGAISPTTLAAQRHWTSQAVLFLLPINYALGRWSLRHSWWSRRGLWALAMVMLWGGGLYLAGADDQGTAMARFLRPLIGSLPTGRFLLETSWGHSLPGGGLALLLMLHAVRNHDPVSAGFATSLLLLIPAATVSLDPFSISVVTSAAILATLVGILESMFVLAYRDGLTGLSGRRGLDDLMPQLGGRFAMAMLDVDHFKRFNDRFGHHTGDDVLKMIAARMRHIPGGRPFRYGGEEFALVFRGRPARTAVQRMERFRQDLAKTPFVIRRLPRSRKKARGRRTTLLRPRPQVKITVSIGVAMSGKGCKKASAVLAAADKALYRAKRAGRNRVVAGK